MTANKAFVGTVATFTDTGPAEPASDYTATINWGKGRKTAGMITGANGQFVVTARHAFPKFLGTKPVTITVTDIADGRTVSVTETASYPVHDAKVAEAKRADKNAGKRLRSSAEPGTLTLLSLGLLLIAGARARYFPPRV